MSYFGGVWSSLKFSSGNAAASWVARTNLRLGGGDGQLIYKNQRHQSVLVHVAKQMAMSTLEGELNKLLPKFEKWVADKDHDVIKKQQEKRLAVLIQDQKAVDEGNGVIQLKDVNGQVVGTDQARDAKGYHVPDALIVSYESKESHTYKATKPVVAPDGTTKREDVTFQTATILLIDLAPQVSLSSNKNIVQTQVQGRDYTRKELVSGGDLEWSVKGEIASDEPYVYPTEAVERFLSIMQYNGIVDVNHFMFARAGVKKIIIKSFNLDPPTYKNIQPYSFSCVAVEPDEEIQVKDTIIKLNEELQASPMNEWYNKILKNKWGRALTEGVMSSATSLTTQSVGMGLDALVPNI